MWALALGTALPACDPDSPPPAGTTTAASSDDTGSPPPATTSGSTTPPGDTTSAPGDSTGAPDDSGLPGESTGPEGTTGSTGSDATGSDATGSTGGDAGLGMLSGECGLIDATPLGSPDPSAFENAIDFRRLGFDYDQLTPDGQAVFDAGNLGGSSLHSEVIAFEVLARCEGATLLDTEATVQYVDPMGIKTDLRVEIDGLPVGVSVTRAVGFPPDDPYTEAQASALLTDKLEDVLASSANVAPADAWIKQILHVIAYGDMHAQSIVAAHAALPPEVRADTILLVTVTHGDDDFVY